MGGWKGTTVQNCGDSQCRPQTFVCVSSLGGRLENSYRGVGWGTWIQVTLFLRRDTISHEKVRSG